MQPGLLPGLVDFYFDNIFHTFQNAYFIGMDIDPKQLKLAGENLEMGNKVPLNVSLIQGDTTSACLPRGSIDKVVTDAPFGHNHTVNCDLELFYTRMLREMSR